MTKNTAINDKIPFYLLIPAAGEATRMGLDKPKPYLKIGNKTVLRHTLDKFLNIKGLERIVNVVNIAHLDLYQSTVLGLKNLSHTLGSKSRKSSIYNGLKEFSKVNKDSIILIHDAARPLVNEKDIYALLDAMKDHDAATLATPMSDTLYRLNETVSRDGLWAIQTPQAFRLGPLLDAHEKFKDDDSFTDDAGLMRAAGHKVAIVEGRRSNIKITTADDLNMVTNMLLSTYETRTASGYDVHAFEQTPSDRKLMLGGLHISHDRALAGHSDADVVLHAVTDALLGTINEGDIGTYFPPSDTQWKDKDSAYFLERANNMLKEKDGIIKFIDITVMAEEPKIGPHRANMQKRIAAILNITPDLVSIKATTTEKLGFVGRKEGIACQALATVALPIR